MRRGTPVRQYLPRFRSCRPIHYTTPDPRHMPRRSSEAVHPPGSEAADDGGSQIRRKPPRTANLLLDGSSWGGASTSSPGSPAVSACSCWSLARSLFGPFQAFSLGRFIHRRENSESDFRIVNFHRATEQCAVCPRIREGVEGELESQLVVLVSQSLAGRFEKIGPGRDIRGRQSSCPALHQRPSAILG